MSNRKELMELVNPFEEAPPVRAKIVEPEERRRARWPLAVAGLTLVGVVSIAVTLALSSTKTTAHAEGTALSLRPVSLSGPSQRTEFKRAQWRSPGLGDTATANSSAASSESRSSRERPGILYSDLRQILRDGIQSELVDLPAMSEWDFLRLERAMHAAGAIENFLLVTEQRDAQARTVSLYTQGSPLLVGTVDLVFKDGRWHLVGVATVVEER